MPNTPIKDHIVTHQVSFGCDPEFFFEKKGKIIGSEKIIDIKDGLRGNNMQGTSKFIVDGVQAELNPAPSTCRQVLGSEIGKCFATLYEKIKDDPTLSVNFSPAIKITKKELDSLADSSKVFGCMPSKNSDKKSENAVKLKDPATYKYRSAGGHIHLGFIKTNIQNKSAVECVMREPERIVQIMDIIVGNTCVLLDRDPGNIERRKLYGRAGEYRTPPYGVEYRTLSNFWLRSYQLMSFVMNLSRFSVSIIANSMPGKDFEKELLSLVNMKKIRQAINKNNYKLALENFEAIKPFLERISPEGQNFPFTTNHMKDFEFFINQGINHWFKEEPIQHWINHTKYGGDGWENFLVRTVRPARLISEKIVEIPNPNLSSREKITITENPTNQQYQNPNLSTTAPITA